MNQIKRAPNLQILNLQNQLLVVRAPAVVSATAIGALDTSVGFSYLMGVEVTAWYALTLIIKVVLIALLKIPGRATVIFHMPALSIGTAVLVISCWLYGAETAVWMGAAGFILHLVATLAALRRDAVSIYLRAIAVLGAGTALIYIAMASSGRLEDHFGRYYFFGGSHPNLGSEIFAMAAVAASMSLGNRAFFLASAPLLIAVTLMQGRAALLVILLAVGIRLFQHLSGQRRRFASSVIFSGIVLPLFLLSDTVRGVIASVVGSAFMADDPDRGAGTGFVGRSDRWQIAWDAFLQKPLFGQGFGFYESTGVASAHNFYMYSLAEFGLVAIPLLAYGVWCTFRIAKNQAFDVLLLSPIFFLTVFNDRFISLNPYPFVMFVLVLAMSVRHAAAQCGGANKGDVPHSGVMRHRNP